MQPSSRKPNQRGAVTIWTAIAVIIIGVLVVLIGIGIFYFLQYKERVTLKNARLEQEARQDRAELERKNAEDQAKITMAQAQRDQVLSPVRSATNLLARLLTGVDQVQVEAQTLRTSDAGKAIALHDDLTELARRVYDTELKALPSKEEITLRLETARRFEQQLLSAAGTTYAPDVSMEKQAQDLISWSTEGEVKLSHVRQSLGALIQESKAKVGTASVTADLPTLEAAMNRLAQKAAASNLKAQEQAATEARAKAEIETAQAEARRIQTEAEAQAKEILAAANAKKEEAERLIREREAQSKLLEAKTQVAVQRHEDEATKVVLRQKASDPQLLAELAPFTTPGYWTIQGVATQKKPLSYTALQNSGALADSMRGLQQLVNIATSGYDRVRPRWDMNRQLWVRKPDLVEKVKSAQKNLIELGPVLVEKGLLEP